MGSETYACGCDRRGVSLDGRLPSDLWAKHGIIVTPHHGTEWIVADRNGDELAMPTETWEESYRVANALADEDQPTSEGEA